ncbi:gamma-glutamyltransferase [Myxosarcina sp. GI1]|uniref:gamma-glutamyltransferase n=1 Tax=Myxosarcina sp. GI1 TaxID=1541065 RepID=UPI00056139F8|nr:gamma-glutamyltransferase [Myxosarcina sp. GI1]
MSIEKKIIIAISSIAILGFGLYKNIDSPFVYRLISKWNCKDSLLPVCNPANAQTVDKVSGNNGVVVSTQKEASKIGLQVLKDGGNAIDAAVAVGYALAVSDPCCGNLGGGGFMLIRFANGESTFIDFRETAPLAATQDMYQDKQGNVIKGLSTEGYLAVGVPGTVKGLDYAMTEYGTMKRDRLIKPAIKLAKNGFVLQQGDVDILEAGKDKLLEPNVAEIFLTEDNKVDRPGDILVQTDLAKTLESIAKRGTEVFYRGEIAEKVVTASEANNGILSLEDFANYQIRETQPISCNYRGYLVISAPPPGGGTTVCQMLNILSGYNLKQLGWQTTKSLHYIFSAMLLAFSDRNQYLGDPDFVEFPLDKLLSKDYAATLRTKISDYEAIPPESVYSNVQTEGSNTTHYSVVDKQGNAVAVTYTINSYFGAGVIAPGTGFLLNNEMNDFTTKLGKPNQFGLRQGEANLIEPGKRPLSSMSPTIVTQDGQVYLVTGSPGGSTIPNTVLQVIVNAIDYDMDLEAAVNTPRLHYQGFPNVVVSEPNAVDAKTIRGLRLRGYTIFPFDTLGAAESILVEPETGLKTGVNDVRKPAGKAVAY